MPIFFLLGVDFSSWNLWAALWQEWLSPSLCGHCIFDVDVDDGDDVDGSSVMAVWLLNWRCWKPSSKVLKWVAISLTGAVIRRCLTMRMRWRFSILKCDPAVCLHGIRFHLFFSSFWMCCLNWFSLTTRSLRPFEHCSRTYTILDSQCVIIGTVDSWFT